ncbi:hypothetical protein HDU67_001220 [Dinochytrium kinnereticum]|nr:hypothetical protein HDU67_001220 [Dinochytrium kinnereticum]
MPSKCLAGWGRKALVCCLVSAAALTQVSAQTRGEGHNHDGHDHDHGSESKGNIIVEHKLNPAAEGFTPRDFVADMFAEFGSGFGASRAMTLDNMVRVYQAMSIIGGESEVDPHAGHNHGSASRLHKRQAGPSNASDVPEYDPCLLPYDLMTIYGFNTTSGVTLPQFQELTPALVYVSSAKLCKNKVFAMNETETSTKPRPTTTQVWLYSIAANTIVTLSCMIGIAFVPFMKKSPFMADLLLSLFIALGAGTLIADALLHLIPQILGLHSHAIGEEHDHDHGSIDFIKDFPYIWSMSLVMLGLYIFWSAEQILNYIHSTYSHKHMHAHAHSHSHNHAVVSSNDTAEEKKGEVKKISLWQEIKTVRPVAILILLGDSLHNFVDGMAIGASFSISVKLGLTTSIAVLLHEMPHELGDYAILYSSGFSALRAGLLNAASNLTSFVGMALGILVSNAAATHQKSQETIFAIAAGMFLYISLSDLMPELKAVHAVSSQGYVEVGGEKAKDTVELEIQEEAALVEPIHPFSWPRIFAQHLGLALGWLVMVLIALYGENIKV